MENNVINNERRLKPLRKYAVTFPYNEEFADVFTADEMIRDEDDLVFYNAGNLVRGYYGVGTVHVVVTPLEALDNQ